MKKLERVEDFVGKYVEFTLSDGDSYESYLENIVSEGYIFNDTTDDEDYAYFVPREHLVMIQATSENNEDEEENEHISPPTLVSQPIEDIWTKKDLKEKSSGTTKTEYKNQYRTD